MYPVSHSFAIGLSFPLVNELFRFRAMVHRDVWLSRSQRPSRTRNISRGILCPGCKGRRCPPAGLGTMHRLISYGSPPFWLDPPHRLFWASLGVFLKNRPRSRVFSARNVALTDNSCGGCEVPIDRGLISVYLCAVSEAPYTSPSFPGRFSMTSWPFLGAKLLILWPFLIFSASAIPPRRRLKIVS